MRFTKQINRSGQRRLRIYLIIFPCMSYSIHISILMNLWLSLGADQFNKWRCWNIFWPIAPRGLMCTSKMLLKNPCWLRERGRTIGPFLSKSAPFSSFFKCDVTTFPPSCELLLRVCLLLALISFVPNAHSQSLLPQSSPVVPLLVCLLDSLVLQHSAEIDDREVGIPQDEPRKKNLPSLKRNKYSKIT